MFKPSAIYYEKEIENYELGKKLLEKYKEVPKKEIENHNNIEEMRNKLVEIIPKLNSIFNDNSFSILLGELDKYDRDVEKHYQDYKHTNEIWNELKNKINNEVI